MNLFSPEWGSDNKARKRRPPAYNLRELAVKLGTSPSAIERAMAKDPNHPHTCVPRHHLKDTRYYVFAPFKAWWDSRNQPKKVSTS